MDERTVTKLRTTGRWAEQFDARLSEAEKRGVRWFTDYRVMFETLGDELDGVVISTPDHMHYPIALSAINLGLHVYCEKPLTHTVEEARLLAEAARRREGPPETHVGGKGLLDVLRGGLVGATNLLLRGHRPDILCAP